MKENVFELTKHSLIQRNVSLIQRNSFISACRFLIAQKKNLHVFVTQDC